MRHNCVDCGRFMAFDDCTPVDIDNQTVNYMCGCGYGFCVQSTEEFDAIWDEIDRERIKDNPLWQQELVLAKLYR